MDIAQEFQQVGVFLAEDGFEPVLEDMAEAFAADIKALGITEHEAIHDKRDGKSIHFNKQVKVVGHEAVGIEMKRLLAFDIGEDIAECPVVAGIEEYFLTAVFSGHDVG